MCVWRMCVYTFSLRMLYVWGTVQSAVCIPEKSEVQVMPALTQIKKRGADAPIQGLIQSMHSY